MEPFASAALAAARREADRHRAALAGELGAEVCARKGILPPSIRVGSGTMFTAARTVAPWMECATSTRR